MVERSGERSGLWCYANRRLPSLVLWAAGSTGGLGFKGERGGNADGICLPSGRRRRDSVQRPSGWSASISEPRELASLPVRRLTLSDLRVLHYESVGLWSDNVNSPLQMDWYWWTGLKGCSCKWMQRIITNEKKRKKQRRGRGESRFCQLFMSPLFFFRHCFSESALRTGLSPDSRWWFSSEWSEGPSWLILSSFKRVMDWPDCLSVSMCAVVSLSARPDRATDRDFKRALALTL